ncbi:MAG: riboflavin synthase [Butyrivibrio sp.]|nr:riboflavin synthase [Butyrivibrio sp.]
MFTGIIEEMGSVKSISRGPKESTLCISCKKVLEDVKIGDSIAVNGICLTVVTYTDSSFTCDVMNETFARSSLQRLGSRSPVNLERAMSACGRFGGHMVSGHIDGTGKIVSIKEDGNAVWFEITASNNILEGIVEKGSIAIDGISLTVAKMSASTFSVSIIPHTLKETVLGVKKVGDEVNLETDIIGKYIKKFCDVNKDNGKITKEFLLQNGFY